MQKTGSCLCGAVRFTIEDTPATTGACHCGMCRKFSGGIYLAVEVAPDKITLTRDATLKRYTSSAWAERAFCSTCGSSLFYRVTAPGPHNGVYHVAFGALDDSAGMDLDGEIFIDEKPEAYSFAGERHRMTGAEVMAMVAPADD